MITILEALLAYLINLASNERSSAIAAGRERKLKETLAQEEALRKAIASTRSIRDELRGACVELARSRTRLGVTPQEEPIWRLLTDDLFQTDLAEWIMAGGIVEGNAAKERLLRAMELALSGAGASPERIAFLKTGYFDTLDKAVFAHPMLAHWRHQLSLDYLREQVTELRRRAEEAAGVYSPVKQKAALDHYCEKALAAWDIIDLSNLPEGDIHMATQKLLLRQLYMPLRITVELTRQGEDDDAALARMEEQREARRHREAGHVFADEDESDPPDREEPRSPVGERLDASRRLVVLGDPGGGKTTMLRWMATAYLLRHRCDAAFSQIPDTQTLPSQPWIPVLIRCRDLGEADLCRSFVDFLTQHLNKTELLPEEAEVMRAVILDRIAKGEALLLIDGLDEITDPDVRVMFCQELERTAARYPEAPIVVTSRIVGYRDMPYRMGSGFEHGQIAELNREDKDLFAQRWVEVTEQHQSAAEKARHAQELLDALHSNDRIERLTGNPMMLTTLALVKRKVGKLPNHRSDLYAEAVQVLLNFNPRHRIIDKAEAIPQIAYLAYEMCRLGVQRLTEDQVLEQLEKFRQEYPNVRSARLHEPYAFLRLIEAQSSILIKSGGIWQRGEAQEKSIWEFRHLTFQEYLAARALLDGRYPGRDKTKSLAEQVAPLAGAVQKAKRRRVAPAPEEEVEVPESWRETLRLLVADCKDDDVDGVLLAILNPLAGEDATKTTRPRAALAALCLADEPNIGEHTAREVLAAFAKVVTRLDGSRHGKTTVDRTAIEMGTSLWSPMLKQCLIEEYCRRLPEERGSPGGLWGMIEVAGWPRLGLDPLAVFAKLVERIGSSNRVERLSAALTTMEAAFEEKAVTVDGLTEGLCAMLPEGGPESHAAAWALLWLSGGWITGARKPTWLPSEVEMHGIINTLARAHPTESSLKRFLVYVLGKVPGQESLAAIISQLEGADSSLRNAVEEALVALGNELGVSPLLAKLDDPDAGVRRGVAEALGRLRDKQAVSPLLARLGDPDAGVRRAVVEALGRLGDKQAVSSLLAKLDDPDAEVRRAVVEALGRLRDRQAVSPLLAKLDDQNVESRAIVAVALHALGDPKGTAAVNLLLTSKDAEQRQIAMRTYARQRGTSDQRLLSRDLDALSPWLDPQEPITKARLITASSRLKLSPDQVRARYEAMAVDLSLHLSWKS